VLKSGIVQSLDIDTYPGCSNLH